jgi:DNA repair exonuclease SbcCD ATPase subunit
MYDNLRAITEQNQARAMEAQKHTESQVALIELQETVVKSFATLVDYLDNKVTKTQVINQLREISTPDAFKVVDAVNSLHETLKTHENTDLGEVTSVLREVLAEAKAIPKELPEAEEQKFVDYSDQIKDLAQAVKSVEDAVKAQKTTVEAPVVNVDAPVVNVPETDLKPLTTEITKAFTKAIQEIPEPKETDLKPVVTEQKKTNKILAEILDKPTGGGGGGGSSWPAVNEEGVTQPLNLVGNSLAVTSTQFPADADITTDLSTPGVIIETDGVRTLTTTITSTEITEVWS